MIIQQLYTAFKEPVALEVFDHLIFPIIFWETIRILFLSFFMVFLLLKKYKLQINYKDKN